MLNYQEYEKAVFDWLMTKHNQDPDFTFTVRQSAVKGAETDYFIGTQKSNYFATTFWTLPISFPGSSQDCINLFFQILKGGGCSYYFEFSQTQAPDSSQNQSALNLVKALKDPLGKKFEFRRPVQEANKIYTIQLAPLEKMYTDLAVMLSDIDKQLGEVIRITDLEIAGEKDKNPNFKAYRVTQQEFSSLIERLNKRLEKHGSTFTHPTASGGVVERASIPCNQILYGPPGTGKTYLTIIKALEIINDDEFRALDQNDRRAVKNLYKKKVDDGQIVFTTFHQSMSYEDFVEGIKPDIEEDQNGVSSVIYNIKDGIFKLLCDKARVAQSSVNNKRKSTFDDAWNHLLSQFDLAQGSEAGFVLPILTPNKGLKVTEITNNGNLRLIPVGSDRRIEYTVSYQRLKRLQAAIPSLAGVRNIDKEFRAVIGGMNSTAYWATLNYINDRLEQSALIEMSGNSTNKPMPHVLIIDEINRGNVSAIFGELITLIEESKRQGNDEVLEITLPYSKSKFSVPNNLYIIGTMNTADRSVESLDTALRRRFNFTEMLPDTDLVAPEKMIYDLWNKHAAAEWHDKLWVRDEANLCKLLGADRLLQLDLDAKQQISGKLDSGEADEGIFSEYLDSNGLNLKRLLERVNKRLERLLSRDHTVGHTFFLGVTTARDLYQAFYNKIIPLLQEYFFGDFGKIGLVLGSGFVNEVKEDSKNIFASFNYEESELLMEKKVYRVKDFQGDEEGFLKALKAI